MPDSGIPFDYSYQYLAGGANTGGGWRYWNSDAQFPLWYAQGASANGSIPFFSYYMLLQSAGGCSSRPEPQKDLGHLNDRALMKSYFNDFRVLMQRLGPGKWGGVRGFGGTTIVQVEPDLSGYAEQAVIQPSGHCYGHCTRAGNSPGYLRAAVASSGTQTSRRTPTRTRGSTWPCCTCVTRTRRTCCWRSTSATGRRSTTSARAPTRDWTPPRSGPRRGRSRHAVGPRPFGRECRITTW
jgi:hypothetical protein